MNHEARQRGMLPREVFKILAMFFMVLDHTGALFYPNEVWMRCVGRLAFPMFAFAIVQGFRHTHSKKKYLITMLIFAAVSEVPFDLMWFRRPFLWLQQNVLFTFAIALLIMMLIESVQNSKIAGAGKIVLIALLTAAGAAAGRFLYADYEACGVLMVLLFYFAGYIESAAVRAVIEAIFMFAMNWYLVPTAYLTISPTMTIPVQGLALLSLPLIWLYQDRKMLSGKAAAVFKYICYAFYPLHLLIIWMISCQVGIIY